MEESTLPEYLMIVDDDIGEPVMVFVDDPGSVFDLRLKLTPLVTSAFSQETEIMVRRLFHVTHGHSSRDLCDECDDGLLREAREGVKAVRARESNSPGGRLIPFPD